MYILKILKTKISEDLGTTQCYLPLFTLNVNDNPTFSHLRVRFYKIVIFR